MQNYIQDTLNIEEEVLITPKLHWAVYLDAYLQFYLLYVVSWHFIEPFISHGLDVYRFFELSQKVIGIFVFLRIIHLFIRNYSVEMAVTNYRVIYKIGILHIRTEELVNSRTEAVIVNQSILGRILNYGDIIFSGTGTSKLVFKKVYAPWWIKGQAEEIIRQSLVEYENYNRYERNYNRYDNRRY